VKNLTTGEELVTPDELTNYGVDYCTRWRKHLEERGLFPKRVILSPRKHAYVKRELIAYAVARIAERDSTSNAA